MKNKLWIFLILALAWGWNGALQAADFAAVTPGRSFQFPRDHGAHPEFQTEWWYFTGHLQDGAGKIYGFQWTVFRSALGGPLAESQPSSPWRAQQIFLGHLAISDLQGRSFAFEESSARGALNLAGASDKDFEVWLPGFSARGSAGSTRLQAQRGELKLDLRLSLPTQVWLQGQGGYSPKSREAGKASYYYSVPNLKVSGRIEKGGKEIEVQGQAWMDHEFGSGQLGPEQSGWDWMGLPLGEGEALMVYRLRDRKDPGRDFIYGGFYKKEGEWQALNAQDFKIESGSLWKSPRSGGSYPLEWRVQAPALKLDLKVRADFTDQELDTRKSTQVIYWEGSVDVSGRSGEREVKSKGYLEMTGYARDFEQDL